MNGLSRDVNHRPDIDGLRGLAVLAVVFHHLAPQNFPGGFVGVDIFFVISGYIITHHLLLSQKLGQFSFSVFYRRRIYRLLPALLSVCCACLLGGYFLMTPADYVMLAKSVTSAILGLSNIFFWHEYGNYFSPNVREAPLLHTWSLSIEEQFYIFWPFILFFLFRVSRFYSLLILFGILVLGIFFSELMLNYFISATYYFLPTRFFELLLGGLLAWIFGVNVTNLVSKKIGLLLALLGWAGFLISFIYITPASSFPGINALLPCIATMLLLIAGTTTHFAYKLLQNRVLIYFGVISYSLYLWHWPVVALLNYFFIDLSGIILLGVLALCILMAEFSWRFIEHPIRQLAFRQTTWRSLFPFFLVYSVILSFNWWVVSNGGLVNRFDAEVSRLESMIKQGPNLLRSGCHVPSALYQEPPSKDKCRLGDTAKVPTMLLWGDSHANHFSGMVDEMAKYQGLGLFDYTMDACPPIIGYKFQDNSAYSQRCIKRNEKIHDFLKKGDISKVILAANWPDNEDAAIAFKETLTILIDMGLQVTVIKSIQRLDKGPECVIRNIAWERDINCSVVQKYQSQYLYSINKSFPSINVIDPNKYICNKGICSSVIGGKVLYRDKEHLNDVGSRFLGHLYIKDGVVF